MPSKPSRSPTLRLLATAFGTIWLLFGLTFTLAPARALPFFSFPVPALASERQLVQSFVVLYAVRDIYMGLATYAAAWYGERRVLGWLLVAGGGVAVADGVVVRAQVGFGEWNHWGYAPIVMGVGVVLLGGLDGRR